jgi:RHS repeat-associated protein
MARGSAGQYADAAMGLDDYSARYYDPLAQQFISADSVLPGQGYDPWELSRYASVHGNPETATDPTGHRCTVDTCAGGGGTGGCGTTCGDGHPGHAGCGNTCGCDKSCRRPPPPPPPAGSPCGGCNARTNPGGASQAPNCDARCQHINYLTKQAGIDLLAGGILQLLALIIDVQSEGAVEALEKVFTIANVLINTIMPALGMIFGGTGPFQGLMNTIAAALNYIGGIASQAIALYKTWGGLAQGAIDAAKFVVIGGLEGVPGILEQLGAAVFGSVASFALQGGSYYFLGQYQATEAEINKENNMTPTQWCSRYGSAYGQGSCG